LLFHCNNGRTKALQCNVIRTLLILFKYYLNEFQVSKVYFHPSVHRRTEEKFSKLVTGMNTWQLSVKYLLWAVPEQRIAWHVWRKAGQPYHNEIC